MQNAAKDFAKVTEHLPDAMALVTIDGHIVSANRRAKVRFRAFATENSNLGELFEFGDARVEDFLRDYARCREPAPGRLMTRTGPAQRSSEAHLSGCLYEPASDTHPPLITLHFSDRARWLSHFRSARERVHELEHQNYQAAEMASQERNRLAEVMHAQRLEGLGILAGGIAHDLNNILTSILGYADLSRLYVGQDSPANAYLDSMINGVQNAAGLTRQLLAYSGKGRFVEENVDLRRLIRDTHELLRVSISPNTKISYSLDSDIPCCKVDSSQIQQVIMNLIINADEAMQGKPGVISIATGSMHCDSAYLKGIDFYGEIDEGVYVWVEVSDNGSGMSEEVRRHIFDPFYSTKARGHGLGLAAVMGIVRGHRGAANVYSEEGRGTTFKLLLPAANGQEQERAEVAALANGVKLEVLAVDDDPMILKLISDIFTTMGANVETAENGQVAVDLFRENPTRFNLVILDMTMPIMDGKTAFRKIQRLNPDIRVLLSSGHNEQTATNELAGKGFAGFLQKPYTAAAIRRAVADLFHEAG